MGIADFCVECGELLARSECPLCSDPNHATKIVEGKIDKVSEVGTTYAEKYSRCPGQRDSEISQPGFFSTMKTKTLIRYRFSLDPIRGAIFFEEIPTRFCYYRTVMPCAKK